MRLPTGHRALAEAVEADAFYGDATLKDPEWRAAWDACPRHLFVPDQVFLPLPRSSAGSASGAGSARPGADAAWAVLDRAEDPDAWCNLVWSDTALVTQVAGGVPSCSSSTPSLVAAMTGALDIAPGMTVLESGTGTGWTAALLSARGAAVTTVEYDPELARAASARLATTATAGVRVRVGSGEQGADDAAPFDRIYATHAVRTVPEAWRRQLRDGGRVGAPVYLAPGTDAYAVLTKDDDGTLSGRIRFPVAFMPSRDPAEAPPPRAEATSDTGRPANGSLDIAAAVAARTLWPITIAVRDLLVTGPILDDGDDTVWLSTPDGSWAVGWTPAGTAWQDYEVRQHGDRDLWAEAESAWNAWDRDGRPDFDDYGLTITTDGQHTLWRRGPDQAVAAWNASGPLPTPG